MTTPTDKHCEWADHLAMRAGTMLQPIWGDEFVALAAQHLAEFEAEVREDMAETHIDKADAWDATIRAGKKRNAQSTRLDAFRNAIKDPEAAQPEKEGER